LANSLRLTAKRRKKGGAGSCILSLFPRAASPPFSSFDPGRFGEGGGGERHQSSSVLFLSSGSTRKQIIEKGGKKTSFVDDPGAASLKKSNW